MPDREAPASFIQNSLAAGEISPHLYGRTDLAKLHQGALYMRNWYVDYRGGASTRAGTQYIGAPGSSGYARLWPFKFSSDIGQTYMLVFSDQKLRFVKNSGGLSYPNSSAAGFILSGGSPYEVTTPYLEADLQFLKFSQVGDELTITRRGYAPRILSRISDTNWTLTAVTFSTFPLPRPTISSISISALPSGSTDPEKTRYQYVVTAVNEDGEEGPASVPLVSAAGIDIGATQGTVTVFFGPIAGAAYYKVYKALPTPGDKVPDPGQQFGFAGYCYGTVFLDSNIVPDFVRGPPQHGNPFTPGQISGYTISASSSNWPVGSTTLSLSGGGSPTRAGIVFPIIDNNTPGGTGSISGIYIYDPGAGYSSAPTVTAAGGGTTFTATFTISPTTGIDPDTTGVFQQRQVYASTNNKPNTVFGSKPGNFTDFRKTNPSVDTDAFEFTVATQQINKIVWMQSMPGGLVMGTDSGVVQLTGGSASASNPVAVTPSSAVIVPQSGYGAADVHPIVIDYDILYVQTEGSYVRDLQYNFFVNIYTGTDITSLSQHLFYPAKIRDWAYQDAPNKVVWAVRDDGTLLSLTWLKAQEILGWSWHQFSGGGAVESIAVVQEGSVDAIYFSINRGGTRFIERLCDRVYYQIDDSWCLDSALSTTPIRPAANLTASGATGNITLTASASVFVAGDVGKKVRSFGGRATITAYTSGTAVSATVDAGYTFPGFTVANLWTMNGNVTTVGGLAHLNGYVVHALADGVVQGPFTVAGGSITLTAPATQVVVGLLYQCDLQPIMFDPGGEATVQGRRKKFTAASIRTKDAARLQYGRTFSTMREFVPGVSSTDPPEDLAYRQAKLSLGDQRIVLDQTFDVLGSMAIRQANPLPATVLAIIPEVAQGDTR